jgi:hypothetical protein
MSGAKMGVGYRRNEYGFPVLERDECETTYPQCMAQTMMAHKVTGAIMGLIFALGAIGWLWTFVLSR